MRNHENMFLICDPLGELKLVNTLLPLGLDSSHFSGETIAAIYPPFELRKIEKAIDFVTSSGHSITQEISLVLQGKKHRFYNQISPIRNAAGQISAVSIIGINITSRSDGEALKGNQNFHDPITGLHNRGYLEEQLNRIEDSKQWPFCLVLGDINGFKRINDTYGHKTGDRILKKAARLIKKSCRKGDIVTRSGGDEFAILMPNSDLRNAEAICQKIRKKFLQTAPNLIPISIAVGYAEKDSKSKSIPEIFQEANARMYRNKLLEQKSSYGSLIASLQSMLYEKSQETEEHAQRIKKLALKMGKSLKLPPHELDNLDLLGALHDIGKIVIPEEILFKPGPLTPAEFKVLQTHAEIGWRIVRTNLHLTQVAEGILAHHERWDGTGYPYGHKGAQIPLISRIIAITDSYDAMTHDRVYRKALDPYIALQEIQSGSGTQFDPELVETFLELFCEDFYQI